MENSEWVQTQEQLKSRLILEDEFTWTLPTTLKYIGGVDLSFSKDDPSIACGALVILDLNNDLNVVYEDFIIAKLDIPYIPGFLAFREAPVLLKLFEKIKPDSFQFYPQLLMVDGNGILHPKGFGLACHLGVLTSIPSIGIGKNLHLIDGLTHIGVKQSFEACGRDVITLNGLSGRTWGAAIRSTPDSSKPIFVSIGHCISLDTAISVVKLACKYRIPEPVRQADIRSRAFLQKRTILPLPICRNYFALE
ncbi:hypothetical protein ACHQM5_016490 [Ranunculus cassubicifolius]